MDGEPFETEAADESCWLLLFVAESFGALVVDLLVAVD